MGGSCWALDSHHPHWATARLAAVLVCCRFFVGAGLGGSTVAFSLFAEFLPDESRGSYLIVFKTLFSVGTLCVAVLAWVVMPRLGWRYLLLFASLPAWWVWLAAWCWVPESPRYLLVRGRFAEAAALLSQMAEQRAAGGEETTPASDSPTASALEAWYSTAGTEGDGDHAGPLSSARRLFQRPLRRVTLMAGLLFFIMAVVYYGLLLLTTEVGVAE